jgi:hypothetical protein
MKMHVYSPTVVLAYSKAPQAVFLSFLNMVHLILLRLVERMCMCCCLPFISQFVEFFYEILPSFSKLHVGLFSGLLFFLAYPSNLHINCFKDSCLSLLTPWPYNTLKSAARSRSLGIFSDGIDVFMVD